MILTLQPDKKMLIIESEALTGKMVMHVIEQLRHAFTDVDLWEIKAIKIEKAETT